ncbi:hypothetical protein QTP88_012430 [Uroleucon formosanum]
MTPLHQWTALIAAVLVISGHVASAQSLCDTPQCECDDSQSQVRCSCRKVPHESQDLVLKAQGPGHVPRVATNVIVTQCDRVKVMAMAFDGARLLQTVEIESVRRLEMADEAFGWSENGGGGLGQPPQQQQHHHHQGLTVTITNVTSVPEVPSYAFRGRLRSVMFNRVRIDVVRPFAFSSLTGTTGRIEFKDTVFGQVDQQAFKKFTVNEFVLKGCRFDGDAPSRMLTEITVHDELRLDNVTFSVVQSYAFRVRGPKVFRVQNSRVGCVRSNAFEVKCHGPAFVEDNAFGRLERGAFAGVTVDSHKVAEADYQEFVFENNTVAEFEDDALVFDTNGFRPRMDWLIVGRACGCPARWRTDLVAFSKDYPRNTDRPSWVVEQTAWCAIPDDDGVGNFGQLVKAQQYDEAHCSVGGRDGGLMSRNYLMFVAVVAVVALTATFVGWAWYKKRKRGQWTNVPASSPLKNRSILKNAGGGGGGGNDKRRHVMVMPEGKTYRETELHVIVERTGSTNSQYRSTTNYQHQRATQPLTSDL